MSTEPEKKRPVFAWRAMTSVLIAASFLILVFSGIILFVSPPGRVANWTNWTIVGLRKHEWIGLHIWFSLLFLVVTLVHVFFNWRPMLSYFKDRMTRRMGFRPEWLAALLVCGAVYAGTRAAVPPFSSLLALNERVKESWDKPRERAPIPHAELLTLAELVEKAGIDMVLATNRLHASGIKGYAPEIVVQQLADNNQRSARQIYDLLTSATRPEAGAGENQGHRGGYGGGGGGGGKGAGGGPGRKTLTQFCTDEGIELKGALARLEAKGINATAELTLREIAVNNGYDRPYELLEILRAK
jgi:uncharacterized membrane protein YgcG